MDGYLKKHTPFCIKIGCPAMPGMKHNEKDVAFHGPVRFLND